jgi:hypothetical protein
MLKPLAGLAAVALCAVGSPSYAALVGATLNADVSMHSQSIDLPSGDTLVFDNNTGGFEGSIGVATTGSAEVFSAFGAPDLFEVYATTTFPNQQLGSFQAYPTSTGIPYSVAVGILGFEFTQADGVHYGLADIGGSTISSYLYDTTPGESIPLNATATVSAAPEPSAWLLMLAGVAGVGTLLRRARAVRLRRGGAALA